MKISLQLYRPVDRHPANHQYGEPFDTEVNNLIGGEKKWSSPREDPTQQPRAKVPRQRISISLHENGPIIDLIVQNVDQIPHYISALAALLTAWVATRELRRRILSKDDHRRESGMVIKIGEFEFKSDRDLEPDEASEILTSLAKFYENRSGIKARKDKKGARNGKKINKASSNKSKSETKIKNR